MTLQDTQADRPETNVADVPDPRVNFAAWCDHRKRQIIAARLAQRAPGSDVRAVVAGGVNEWLDETNATAAELGLETTPLNVEEFAVQTERMVALNLAVESLRGAWDSGSYSDDERLTACIERAQEILRGDYHETADSEQVARAQVAALIERGADGESGYQRAAHNVRGTRFLRHQRRMPTLSKHVVRCSGRPREHRAARRANPSRGDPARSDDPEPDPAAVTAERGSSAGQSGRPEREDGRSDRTVAELGFRSALEAALAYSGLGWSVIPTAGKEPHHGALVAVHRCTGWARFRQTPASDNEIRAWYEHAPDAGVAILTGTCSGLVVCDIEADRLQAAPRGIIEALTPKATTPSGGLHVYFAADERVASLARAATVWGDLKADGGYVVAPSGTAERVWQPSPWTLKPAQFTRSLLLSKSLAEDHAWDSSPRRGNPSLRGSSSLRGIPSLSNLADWDKHHAYVDAVTEVIGIPTSEIGRKFRCVLPGHGSDSRPSANLTRHPSTGAVLYRCWHDNKTYPLVKVYAAVVSGHAPAAFSGATLAIWQIRLLLEAGLVPRAIVEVPPLPLDAPPHARKAHPGLVLLFEARALSEMGRETPLVPAFLAPWCGISVEHAKEARHYFRTHGIVHKTGTKHGRAFLYLPGLA